VYSVSSPSLRDWLGWGVLIQPHNPITPKYPKMPFDLRKCNQILGDWIKGIPPKPPKPP
jgi:hypothetical protein